MKERWTPEVGERYYFISAAGEIIPDTFYNYEAGSRSRFLYGNVFETQAAAEAAAEKIKALLLSLQEEQPVTDCSQLPDWVEIGGYVYDARNGYGKIVSGSVKSCYIEFDSGAGDFVPEAFAELKPARLRLYNAEEMKALVGKVICGNDTNFRAMIVYADGVSGVVETIHYDYNAEELAQSYTIDGKPCGVLEHLENGEWVE